METETDDAMAFVSGLLSLVKGEVTAAKTPGKLYTSRMWWGKEEETKIETFLVNNNVTTILNLIEQSHGNLGPAEEVWSPINDYQVPKNAESFLKCIDTVVTLLKDGKNVLVHCYAGHGRTGLAIATILWRLGYSKQEALALAKEATSGPERQTQVDFVLKL